jgi:nucleoid-associated protein YgaU
MATNGAGNGGDAQQVSVEILTGSYLGNIELGAFEGGIVAWQGLVRPDLSERPGDLIVVLDRELRPEQIAQRAYNNPRLWWIIALANGIEQPIVELYPGRQLRIPDPSFILTEIQKQEPLR